MLPAPQCQHVLALPRTRQIEALLAAVTLLQIVVDMQSPPQRFPTWLDVGAVTLPVSALYPVPVALFVVGVAVAAYRRDGAVGLPRLLEAALATVVLATAVYAVVVLNQTTGGVFFAGLPPLVLGSLLCAVVVCDAAITTGLRRYRTASENT